MNMYDCVDVKNIVEEFLAEYLNLYSVTLTASQSYMLDEIMSRYGIEVENIQRQ